MSKNKKKTSEIINIIILCTFFLMLIISFFTNIVFDVGGDRLLIWLIAGAQVSTMAMIIGYHREPKS